MGVGAAVTVGASLFALKVGWTALGWVFFLDNMLKFSSPEAYVTSYPRQNSNPRIYTNNIEADTGRWN